MQVVIKGTERALWHDLADHNFRKKLCRWNKDKARNQTVTSVGIFDKLKYICFKLVYEGIQVITITALTQLQQLERMRCSYSLFKCCALYTFQIFFVICCVVLMLCRLVHGCCESYFIVKCNCSKNGGKAQPEGVQRGPASSLNPPTVFKSIGLFLLTLCSVRSH